MKYFQDIVYPWMFNSLEASHWVLFIARHEYLIACNVRCNFPPAPVQQLVLWKNQSEDRRPRRLPFQFVHGQSDQNNAHNYLHFAESPIFELHIFQSGRPLCNIRFSKDSASPTFLLRSSLSSSKTVQRFRASVRSLVLYLQMTKNVTQATLGRVSYRASLLFSRL